MAIGIGPGIAGAGQNLINMMYQLGEAKRAKEVSLQEEQRKQMAQILPTIMANFDKLPPAAQVGAITALGRAKILDLGDPSAIDVPALAKELSEWAEQNRVSGMFKDIMSPALMSKDTSPLGLQTVQGMLRGNKEALARLGIFNPYDVSQVAPEQESAYYTTPQGPEGERARNSALAARLLAEGRSTDEVARITGVVFPTIAGQHPKQTQEQRTLDLAQAYERRRAGETAGADAGGFGKLGQNKLFAAMVAVQGARKVGTYYSQARTLFDRIQDMKEAEAKSVIDAEVGSGDPTRKQIAENVWANRNDSRYRSGLNSSVEWAASTIRENEGIIQAITGGTDSAPAAPAQRGLFEGILDAPVPGRAPAPPGPRQPGSAQNLLKWVQRQAEASKQANKERPVAPSPYGIKPPAGGWKAPLIEPPKPKKPREKYIPPTFQIPDTPRYYR